MIKYYQTEYSMPGYLQGRVKFPTGGDKLSALSPRAERQIWLESKADSTVWMKEDE
jgi:hypothetical protein